MNLNLRSLFLFVSCTLVSLKGFSQRYIGIATSDWNAINSLYLNPADIADCREKFSIGLFSLNVGVDNNLGGIPKLADISNALHGDNNIFTNSNKKSFSMIVPEVAVRGPGIMVSISKKISMALTTDIRLINQFNNFSPAFYKTLTGIGTAPDPNYSIKMQNFNWTVHMWSEIGLTFAAVVSETDHSRLNLGVTVRRLGGIGYISILGKNMDMSYREQGADSFFAINSDLYFGSNVVNDSSSTLNRMTPSGFFDKLFDESAGGGMSADLGVTYRYRIGEANYSKYMESEDTHDLIFSAAITDFGAINYFNSTNANFNISGSGFLTGKALNTNTSSVASLVNYTKQQGFDIEEATRSKKVYLPTALVISGDVQVYGRFFTNLMYIANLANRLNFGNSYYNQVTLTPRYDYHTMTLSLPITYSMLARDFKMGIAARYKGFFIGSDDALAAFTRWQYGFNIYFGGYVPIFKKKTTYF